MRGARLLAAAMAVAGMATLAVGIAIGPAGGLDRPVLVLAAAAVLALGERFPPPALRQGATPLALEESFLAALALLLPPVEALGSFAVGVTAGVLARRLPPGRTALEAGRLVSAAGVALLVADLAGPARPVTPRGTLAVAGATVVFVVLNHLVVAAAAALEDRRSFAAALGDDVVTRALVSSGTISLGVLVGLVGSAYLWALPICLAPVATLHLAYSGHLRARRGGERLNALFRAVVTAHASIGADEVEHALIESARHLLHAPAARITHGPPEHGELGTRLRTTLDPDRWLTVSARPDGPAFDEADRELLDAMVAVAATALDNAALYEQARQERQKLADLVAASSDGIFSVDGDGALRSWNPAMERITGLAEDAVIGRHGEDVLHPVNDAGDPVTIARPPGTGPGIEVPLEVTTGAGERRWLGCTWSTLPGGGHVVLARDVTAQRELDELKADFLATVTHELRTPLTPIQGFLQTLLRDDAHFDADQRHHFYVLMLRQADRLERLVRDLLDATTLDDSEQLFLPEEVDWSSTVQRVVELFRGQDPDHRYVLEVPEGLPAVVADEQRAEQVLSNLLSNAAKYSGAGKDVSVIVAVRGDEVVTTVTDQGPGVPASARERVFDRFTRLGDHLTRRAPGAGLGLYIARRLVETMGGRIEVGPGPDGGAAFTFSLPVRASVRGPLARR